MPAKPLPSLEYLRECFEYFPETGELVWKERPRGHFKTKRAWVASNNRAAGKPSGGKYSERRIQLKLDGKKYKAHRICYALGTGHDPGDLEIDHVNRNPSDNRLRNLRLATHAQNNANQSLRSTNTTGVKNVMYERRRNSWRVSIRTPGKRYDKTGFKRYGDAVRHAFEMRVKLHGDFAA